MNNLTNKGDFVTKQSVQAILGYLQVDDVFPGHSGRPGPAPEGDLGGRTWNVNLLPSGISHHWNIQHVHTATRQSPLCPTREQR